MAVRSLYVNYLFVHSWLVLHSLKSTHLQNVHVLVLNDCYWYRPTHVQEYVVQVLGGHQAQVPASIFYCVCHCEQGAQSIPSVLQSPYNHTLSI